MCFSCQDTGNLKCVKEQYVYVSYFFYYLKEIGSVIDIYGLSMDPGNTYLIIFQNGF